MAGQYTQTPWKPKGDPAALLVTSARLNNMEAGIYLSSAPVVTSLPASPVDGQECNLLVDATNGVMWHLVYRLALGKWLYTGGAPLFGYANGSQNVGYTGAWASFADDPALVLPVAGDYDIEVEHLLDFRAGATSQITLWVGPKVGSVFADALAGGTQFIEHSWPGTISPIDITQRRMIRVTGVTAGTTVTLAYQMRSNAGNVMWVYRRALRIWPAKIG